MSILPALQKGNSRVTLRHLARNYRRAAAAAPSRPHTWLISKVTSMPSKAGVGGWLSAAAGAAGRVVRRPLRVGVAAVDAAADVVHYGPSQAPLKT